MDSITEKLKKGLKLSETDLYLLSKLCKCECGLLFTVAKHIITCIKFDHKPKNSSGLLLKTFKTKYGTFWWWEKI